MKINQNCLIVYITTILYFKLPDYLRLVFLDSIEKFKIFKFQNDSYKIISIREWIYIISNKINSHTKLKLTD